VKRPLSTRRWFLVGSVGLLAGWEPTPVPLRVVNASGEDVDVRLAGEEAWTEVKAGAEILLRTLVHHGLCSPSDRWLPESFAGLEFKLADDSVVEVSREAFEKEAEHKRGWTYRFRG
jgi:hypothetical protein